MKTQHLISLVIFLLIGLGCQPSQTVLNDRNPTPEPTAESTPEIPMDDFAERLKSVQTGNFDFVYVFRRKDGGVFTTEDKQLFRENTADVNQRQLTSDGKALIVGSNYAFAPENFEVLKNEFKVENYSPKKDEPKKPVNSNLKQNSNVNR